MCIHPRLKIVPVNCTISSCLSNVHSKNHNAQLFEDVSEDFLKTNTWYIYIYTHTQYIYIQTVLLFVFFLLRNIWSPRRPYFTPRTPMGATVPCWTTCEFTALSASAWWLWWFLSEWNMLTSWPLFSSPASLSQLSPSMPGHSNPWLIRQNSRESAETGSHNKQRF